MNNSPDRNWGCRISDEHTFRGLRTLILENELLRVTVLLDKGADIYEFLYKPLDIDFMWRAPNPLRDPRAFVPTGPRPDGFFMDFYHGGWQEIFPTGGTATQYHGVDIGQHGEVSTIPWNCRITVDEADVVEAKMWTHTYRTPFRIRRTMRLESGKAALFMDEKITNTGGEDLEYMWGHHPAVGAPFLDESCRIHVPATRVEVHPESVGDCARLVPGASFDAFPMVTDKDGNELDLSRIPAPESKTCDMCYLLGLEQGWYAITSENRGAGFGMAWDKEVFPVVWLWEVFGGSFGFPWYGATYNLAMEPWTSHPGGLHNARERGTVPVLAAGQSFETSLCAVAFDGITSVQSISATGAVSGK